MTGYWTATSVPMALTHSRASQSIRRDPMSRASRSLSTTATTRICVCCATTASRYPATLMTCSSSHFPASYSNLSQLMRCSVRSTSCSSHCLVLKEQSVKRRCRSQMRGNLVSSRSSGCRFCWRRARSSRAFSSRPQQQQKPSHLRQWYSCRHRSVAKFSRA